MIPGLPPLKVLETITLTGSASTVRLPASGNIADHANFPSGSRHVVVLVSGGCDRSNTVDGLEAQFNGDTGTNYHWQYIYGAGSGSGAGLGSSTETAHLGLLTGATAGEPLAGTSTILLPHAFGSDNHKAWIQMSGGAEHQVFPTTGRWANTAAITSMLFLPETGDFVSGTVFKLCVVDESYAIATSAELESDGSFTFDSIPGTDPNLTAICYLRSTKSSAGDSFRMDINDDATDSNYTHQYLYTDGSSIYSGVDASTQIGNIPAGNATAGTFGAYIVSFSQHALGANDPHMQFIGGFHELVGPTSILIHRSHRRNNVEAITKLHFKGNGAADLAAGSMVSLYGTPKVLLERKTLTDATTTSVTFTLSGLTIPDNVKDLRLNVYAKGDEASVYDWVSMSINSDTTAANYDNQELYGIAGSVGAGTSAASRRIGTIGSGNSGANVFGGFTALFPNYASTDRHKHYLSVGGASEQIANMLTGRWENDNAIATITLTLEQGDDFVAGSIIELEGIGDLGVWIGTVNGIDNPGKVNGIDVANIEKIMGVASA